MNSSLILALLLAAPTAEVPADSVASDTTLLHEVVVTATAGKGVEASVSRIDRDAMRHLQPTSFTDLLSLLPGGSSRTPDMTSVNAITLRETGTLGATGAEITSADYNTSSLGTLFVIDGAPVSTDANLQVVGTGTQSNRISANRGVDMRSIATDNIATVEIVRGIPSAEYGNLTSGMVNIKRMRRATPLTARFKADEFSKLFFAGKGFRIGDQVVNVDLGWLDSKGDPRNSLNSYKRLTASARGLLEWTSDRMVTRWNVSADFTASIDNYKTDPDISLLKVDELRSRYNRYALISDLTFTFSSFPLLRNVALLASASYDVDRLHRLRQVAPGRATIAPTSMSEGEHPGHFILQEYIADYLCEGRPLDLFVKLRGSGRMSVGEFANSYKLGVEWSMAKNYGRGQVYDIERPLSSAWTARPRAYSDIPALHTVSAYVEDDFSYRRFSLRAGLRMVALPSLGSRYYLNGRPYLDPRINVSQTLLRSTAPVDLTLSAGWGLATRMPTVDYLFPQVNYNDYVELNHYDHADPVGKSMVMLRTYIDDPTNYDLRPARNRKVDLALNLSYGANRLSVSYFNERLRSGFRYESVYRPYSYRAYRWADGATSVDQLDYADREVLGGYSRVTNGSRIDKQGVEFQLTTARWRPLATALTVTGAWFRSVYSNSQRLQRTVNDVVGGQAVYQRYVGIYQVDEGRLNERINTNFLFDTQIPRLGLIFSTGVECMWHVKTRSLAANWTPVAYVSVADGMEHAYTPEAVAADPLLRYLEKPATDTQWVSIPTAVYVNLKVTKKIGRYLNLSAFANRIVDYLPDYESNGMTVRRTADIYFGMELNLTI